MIDLTPLMNAIIAFLAAIILRYVIPWVNAQTNAKQRENVLAWVDVAVAAAQQLYYHLDGETRLQYALDFLKQKGFDIEDDVILDAVEAAVLKLHQGLVSDNDG